MAAPSRGSISDATTAPARLVARDLRSTLLLVSPIPLGELPILDVDPLRLVRLVVVHAERAPIERCRQLLPVELANELDLRRLGWLDRGLDPQQLLARARGRLGLQQRQDLAGPGHLLVHAGSQLGLTGERRERDQVATLDR